MRKPLAIALLILLAGCHQSQLEERQPQFVLLVFDNTGSYKSTLPRAFQASERILNLLRPGDSFAVQTISQRSFVDEDTILSGLVPKSNKPIDVDGRLLLTRLTNNWEKEIRKNITGDARRTDVMGAVISAGLLLHDSSADQKILVLFTDLESNVELKTSGASADLTGVKVRVLCVPKRGDPASYTAKLQVWKHRFEQLGATDVRILTCDETEMLGNGLE